MNKHKVYIVKKENCVKYFSRCFDEIVLQCSGKIGSVLLKPNFVNDLPSEKGVTTSLHLIDLVVDFLLQNGIIKIAIAEGSIQNTESVLKSLGVYEKYERKGVTIVNLEKSERITVNSPVTVSAKSFSIPKIIDEYDLLINMPKMKTHALTGVSLGMKNLFAFFSLSGRRFAHLTDIDNAIVDMYAYIRSAKPILTIMDSIVAMSGNHGPIHGNPLKLDMLLVGNDTVAVDAAATEIMGSNYKAIKHISIALEKKLGVLPDIHNDDGLNILDIKKKFHVPTPFLPAKDRFVKIKNSIFKKEPFLEHASKCTKCLSCVKICPKNCINFTHDTLVINYGQCVGCLCCNEACKFNAMGYGVRFGMLYNFLLFFKKTTTGNNNA